MRSAGVSFNEVPSDKDLTPTEGPKAWWSRAPSRSGNAEGGRKNVRVKPGGTIRGSSRAGKTRKRRLASPDGMERAAIYCRVSTEEQVGGWSLEGQLDACRSYCERNGYRVTRRLMEQGSGMHGDREGFQHIIQAALQGKYDVLVVWNRDRFGRDPITNAFYERLLKDAGIRLEATDTGRQDTSPFQEFANLVLDGAKRLEVQETARRLRLGKESAAQRGSYPTRPPFGYVRDPDTRKLVLHRQKAAVVRRIFDLYLNGWAAEAIGQEVSWSRRCIERRLSQPAYKGEAHYKEFLVPVPAIVTPEEWQRVQDLKASRRGIGQIRLAHHFRTKTTNATTAATRTTP